MEDCSKRAEALCELNLKGFAPESRVNAIKSAVGIVCLAVVTVALLAWMDFAQPKESAGQEDSLSKVRESVQKVRYFMANGFKMLLILYEEKRLPGLFYF